MKGLIHFLFGDWRGCADNVAAEGKYKAVREASHKLSNEATKHRAAARDRDRVIALAAAALGVNRGEES